jgi:hypothetical protein
VGERFAVLASDCALSGALGGVFSANGSRGAHKHERFTFIAIATNHWIKEFARQQGASANIPPKRNRKDRICFSPYLYRGWNLIERFFNKIKQCRRVGPGTTNSQPTIWRLSRSRQFEFGYALMSPRPNASSALRLLTAALSSEYVSTIIPAYRTALL